MPVSTDSIPKMNKLFHRRIAEIRMANRFLCHIAQPSSVDGGEIDRMLRTVQGGSQACQLAMRPALEKLIDWHLDDMPSIEARIIIAPTEASHGSLWLLSQLEQALQGAQKDQALILIVSGLREWIAGSGTNWTRNCQSNWEDTVILLEEKAVRHSQENHSPISLLFT